MNPKIHHQKFDHVEVDVSNLRLTVEGEIRQLEPRAFRLLVFLMENRGRVVAKEEIFAAVWDGVFVTDNALARAVAQVRKALGDDPKVPRYIETVPTVGYRFLPELETLEIAESVAIPLAPLPLEQMERENTPANESVTITPRNARWRLPLALGLVLVTIGVAWVLLRKDPVVAVEFKGNSQFTTGTGLDVNATYSPDGKLMAYASDKSGRFEIYLRTLEVGAREIQLTNDGADNLFPAFSHDGQSIAYSSIQKPGIYRLPVLGGKPQRITEFGARPAWSPDDKMIAFVTSVTPSMSTTDYYWPTVQSTIWVTAAAGGDLRQVTTRTNPTGGQTFPSWSPDGEEIRFVNYFSRQASLWTYRLRDGQLRKRFDAPPGSTLGSALFGRDDRLFYYVTCELNGNVGVWAMPLEPKALVPAGPPKLLYAPAVGSPRDLSVHPKGDRILYSAVTPQSKILVAAVGADGRLGEPSSVALDGAYRYTQPRWAPDHHRLAYVKWLQGQPSRIVVRNLDDSREEPIEFGEEIRGFNSPHFVRGGEDVQFLAELGGGRWAILRRNLKTGALSTLWESIGLSQANFSPDGRLAIFHNAKEEVFQLQAVELPGGKPKQLTEAPHVHGFGQLSPDLKRVAYQELEDSAVIIEVKPLAGGKPEFRWEKPGQWFMSGWTPDGKALIGAGNAGHGWGIWAIPIDGGAARRMTEELPLRMYIRYPRMSGDGKRMAYEFNESRGNVFVAKLEADGKP